MVKSFCLYNEVELPEELKEMVAEVEEKIALIKEEREKESSLEAAPVLEEKDGGAAPDAENTRQEEGQPLLEQEESDPEEQGEISAVQKCADAPIAQEDTSEIQEEDAGHCKDGPEPPETGEGGLLVEI